MDDMRVGAWVRSERRRLGLRQSDLAERAGVSSQTVLRIEHGRLAGTTVGVARAVAGAVGIRLPFAPRSLRGASIERQIDRRHAALVEAVLSHLAACRWEATPEWSFNDFGDRGSVDVLAWHPAAGALLLVETKSELRDVQETLRALDVKRRVVPRLVAAGRHRPIAGLGVVMVVADLRSERDRIARHGATFGAALPARTVEVKHWIKEPQGELRGVWFLQIPRQALPVQKTTGRERVGRPQA